VTYAAKKLEEHGFNEKKSEGNTKFSFGAVCDTRDPAFPPAITPRDWKTAD
jgi:hypothetical protein